MGSASQLQGGVQVHNKIEKWYKEKSGATLDKKKYTYIMGGHSDDIKSLVLYSDYTEYSITMDICAPRALTRKLINLMFDYPFNQLKVKKLFGYIDARNIRSQRTFLRLGCRPIARIPDFFGEGIDRLVFEATKEDVRKWVT